MTINFNRYEEFVSAVTSDASTNFVDFADRIGELDREGANIERLLTSCLLYTSPSPRDGLLSRMPSSA